MDRRAKNVEIFTDTVKQCQKVEQLRNCISQSRAGQKLYLTDVLFDKKSEKSVPANVVVSGKRSFEAAAPYAWSGKRVCVLNFASSTNPGGGVLNGSSAQEEALCRCSTLYFNLNTSELMNKFYIPHRRMNNPLYNDDCVYTPGVTVFKNDISFPELLEERAWYQVDVLTCAAPNLRRFSGSIGNPEGGAGSAAPDEERLKALFRSRIRKIFAIAAKEGAQVLILGAFGCGAFRNPPKIVAGVFKEVQAEYLTAFDTIEYAVFYTERETENYRVFRDVLGEFSGIQG